MRLMGIDYGTKRVGVALSDEEGRMAFPHGVFPNDASLIGALEEVVTTHGVGQVVIGHSVDRSGVPNKIHEAVESLILELTLRVGIPIVLESELYTTREAVRIQGKHSKTDASAAALILNSYIMKQRSP